VGETTIAWCDFSFNPWIGCSKVSPGCDHCYAEAWSKRSGLVKWGEARRRTSAANWRAPLKWNREAAAAGVRRRVFCASLADVFDNEVEPQWRHDLFALIHETPHLDWLLLTKRIGNATKLVDQDVFRSLPNVWIGATVVNQEEVDRDIPKLLAVPARVRFLSMEPLLGPVNLAGYDHIDGLNQGNAIRLIDLVDWVIVGGESGPGARPCAVEWIEGIVEQCQQANTAVFIKQLGAFVVSEERRVAPEDVEIMQAHPDGWAWRAGLADRKGGDINEWPENLRVREFPA
jgi:protein gp37